MLLVAAYPLLKYRIEEDNEGPPQALAVRNAQVGDVLRALRRVNIERLLLAKPLQALDPMDMRIRTVADRA